jgi:WD40 repeat protein
LNHLSDTQVRVLRPVAPPPERPESPRFEIFHDVLAAAVLDWRRRYQHKIDQHKAARKAAEAEQRQRLEERARLAGRLRWAVAALAVLFLVAATMGLLAWRNEGIASVARALADQQRLVAQKQAQLAGASEIQARIERDEAQKQKAEAEKQRQAAERLRHEADHQREIAFARELSAEANDSLDSDADRSLWLAFTAVLRQPAVPQAEQALHRAIAAARSGLTLTGHAAVAGASLSPDGTFLVAAFEDGTLRVWDLAQARSTLLRAAHRAIRDRDRETIRAAFVRNGAQVLSAGPEGALQLSDASSGRQLDRPPHAGVFRDFAVSSDGLRLAVPFPDGKVAVWDLPGGQKILEFSAHEKAVRALAFSRDGKRLATAGLDSGPDATARVWDLDSRELVAAMAGHTQNILAVAFSPDGRLLATGGQDRTARAWHASSGQLLRTLTGHTDDVSGVAFSPDGSLLATASFDKTAKLWEVGPYQEVLHLPGHADQLTGVLFHPDGARIVTTSRDKTIRIWNIASDQDLLTLTGPRSQVRSLAFSADGRRLAGGYLNGTVKVWDVASGWDSLTLQHPGGSYAARFSPDGAQLTTAGSSTLVWDLASGRIASRGPGARTVSGFAFHPDGRVVYGDSDGVFFSRPGDQRDPDFLAVPNVRTLAVSPDGAFLATGSTDFATGRVQLWRPPARRPVWVSEPISAVDAVAFSPDGRYLASGHRDGRAVLWDVRSGKPAHLLAGHNGWVLGVAFAPDGKRFATASMDKTVKLWDLATGKEILTLTGHSDRATLLAFSPDGRLLASAGYDGSIRLYAAGASALLALARARLNRGPSAEECGRYFSEAECRRLIPAFASLVKGRELARAGSLVGAVEALRSAQRSEPALAFDAPAEARRLAAEGLLAAGRNLARAGNVTRAAGLLQQAKELNPDLGLDPKAMATRLAVLRLDADARSLARVGDLEAAVERFERARQLDSTRTFDPRAEAGTLAAGPLIAEARALAMAGNVDGAISLFRRAQALSPKSVSNPEQEARSLAANSFLSRGRNLADAGDYQAAAATLERALHLNPGLKLDPAAEARRRAASFYVENGHTNARLGNAGEALSSYRKALELNPSLKLDPQTELNRNRAESLLQQALEYAQRGNFSDAAAWFGAVRKLDPVPKIAASRWNHFCWEGALAGAAAEVLFACDQAVTLQNGHPPYRDSRGVARALTGKTQEAIEDLTAALEADRDEEWKDQRRRWITALRAGRNPFSPEEINTLRDD